MTLYGVRIETCEFNFRRFVQGDFNAGFFCRKGADILLFAACPVKEIGKDRHLIFLETVCDVQRLEADRSAARAGQQEALVGILNEKDSAFTVNRFQNFRFLKIRCSLKVHFSGNFCRNIFCSGKKFLQDRIGFYRLDNDQSGTPMDPFENVRTDTGGECLPGHTPSGRCIQKPYDGGEEAYGKDLIDRYNRGEMISADSIHFPDSLKYSTLVKGRAVYGGGGIMPDVFVPMDTTRFTPLHRLLVNRGILNRFALSYVDDHRSDLKTKYPQAEDFIDKYEVSDEMIADMMALAEAEKVKIKDEDRNSDKTVLKLQTKAYMARDLYKTAAYYQVMVPENEALQKALEILNSAKLRKEYGLK